MCSEDPENPHAPESSFSLYWLLSISICSFSQLFLLKNIPFLLLPLVADFLERCPIVVLFMFPVPPSSFPAWPPPCHSTLTAPSDVITSDYVTASLIPPPGSSGHLSGAAERELQAPFPLCLPLSDFSSDSASYPGSQLTLHNKNHQLGIFPIQQFFPYT